MGAKENNSEVTQGGCEVIINRRTPLRRCDALQVMNQAGNDVPAKGIGCDGALCLIMS
jgi:hypothetical protein